MKPGVYEIVNTLNQHRYIGSTVDFDKRWRMHKRRLIVCDQCGKEYMGEKGRFCSNSCKSKWRRESGIDDEIRKCIVCDEEFSVNKYSDTVTCSRSCGRTLGWQQNRQGN